MRSASRGSTGPRSLWLDQLFWFAVRRQAVRTKAHCCLLCSPLSQVVFAPFMRALVTLDCKGDMKGRVDVKSHFQAKTFRLHLGTVTLRPWAAWLTPISVINNNDNDGNNNDSKLCHDFWLSLKFYERVRFRRETGCIGTDSEHVSDTSSQFCWVQERSGVCMWKRRAGNNRGR